MRCALALAFAACLLAGCQRRDAAGDWFPRVAGAYWEYELEAASGRSQLRVDARGETEVPELGLRLFLAEETRSDGGPFDAVNPVGYVVDGSYVARISGLVYDGAGRLRVIGGAQATRILPLAPSPGLRWAQETWELGDAGSAARLSWGAVVRGRAEVDVPAGRFDDVVEVETTLRDAEGAVIGRYRDTFARNVGLVHGSARIGSEAAPRVEELRLIRYRVPPGASAPAPQPGALGRSGDALAPLAPPGGDRG
jgi:hypothetical protein